MTQQLKAKLIPLLLPLATAVLGVASTFAVTNYRVDEQANQIKVLNDTTVKRSEYEELQKRLDRIENKLDRNDEHLLQHMQQAHNLGK